MPDITMCRNGGCPLSDFCWRFGCPPDNDRQSYARFEYSYNEHCRSFNDIPFKCDYFIEYPEFDK